MLKKVFVIVIGIVITFITGTEQSYVETVSFQQGNIVEIESINWTEKKIEEIKEGYKIEKVNKTKIVEASDIKLDNLKEEIKGEIKKSPKVTLDEDEKEKETIKKDETKKDEKVKVEAKKANTIYMANKAINYKNGGKEKGQSIIDNDIQMASTWGGASVYSGNDNQNTHFIAHAHGVFNGIWKLKIGAIIEVTDKDAISTNYKLNEILKVDTHGIGEDGISYWDKIVGYGEEERITIQTCVPNSDLNYILFASKI